jgi:CheY-like chemotaxis protein
MDGVAATQAIRRGEAGPDTADVPVVALTAYAMTGDRETFLRAGMDAYVAKPVDMDELTRAITTALRRKRA